MQPFLTRRLAISSPVPTAPPGLVYQQFQLEGIQALLSKRKMILADEMGLGKTVQVIGAINAMPTKVKVLIVCPKSVLGVWQSELAKWLVRPLCVATVAGSAALPAAEETDIVIMNYDIVHKHVDAIATWGRLDVLVCDEAHYLKNPETRRTMALLGDTKVPHTKQTGGINAKCVWLLTGSPMLNHPVELYPLLKAVDPEARALKHLHSFYGFRKRYCDPAYNGWGWDYSGVSNQEELQDGIARGRLMLRRLRANVLSLPPKTRQVVPLNDPKVAKRERALLDKAMKMTKPTASTSVSWMRQELISRGLGVENIDFTELSRVRHETAKAKVKYAVEFLKEVTGTHKAVVFAHHQDVVGDIAKAFGERAVSVTGRTEIKARVDAVKQFQENPEVRLFVGSTRACGQGITLTSASHVVFVEYDWSPMVMAQAEDRSHRIGQHSPLLVQFLHFVGTIDEKLFDVLAAKMEKMQPHLISQTFSTPKSAELRRHLALVQHKANALTEEKKHAMAETERARSELYKMQVEVDRLRIKELEAGQRLAALQESEAAVQEQLRMLLADLSGAEGMEQQAVPEHDDDFGDIVMDIESE